MKQLDRWYVTFGDKNIICILPPRVTERKATEVALKQAEILESESPTLKLSARLYDK